jgi:hypothetical protein
MDSFRESQAGEIKERCTEVLNELARPAMGLSAGVRRQKNVAQEPGDSGARPHDPTIGERPLPVLPVVAPDQIRHVVTGNHEKKDSARLGHNAKNG